MSAAMPVESRVKDVAAKADKFPLDGIVDRYIRDHSVPPVVAAEHARELKRYLTLCALFPDAGFTMKGPVDDLWHTFILFTADYQTFCADVAGRFLHHVPAPSVPRDAKDVDASYDAFLQSYEFAFGEEAPRHVWPRRSNDMRDGTLPAGLTACCCKD